MEIKIKEEITATLSENDLKKLIRKELESQGYEVVKIKFETGSTQHGGYYEPSYTTYEFKGVHVELKRRKSCLDSNKPC